MWYDKVMYYVHVLKSEKDKKWYIGFTSDLKRRFEEHNRGWNASTRHRRPFVLLYYEAYVDKQRAIRRERRLKQFKNTYRALRKRLEDE